MDTNGTRAPDYVTPVEMWRLWTVMDDGTLRSPMYSSFPWTPGWVDATCARVGTYMLRPLRGTDALGENFEIQKTPEHETPSPDCHCGIYGLANPFAAVLRGWSVVPGVVTGQRPFCVLGRVAFDGRFVEYDNGAGMRAARARVTGLVKSRSPRTDADTHARVAAASRRYDVPVLAPDADAVVAQAADLLDQRQRTFRADELRWSYGHQPPTSYHAVGQARDVAPRRRPRLRPWLRRDV